MDDMYGQAEFTGWTVATGTGDLAQREEGRMTTTDIDASGYTAGDVVEIANIIASMDRTTYPSAEAKARAVIPAVLRLLEDKAPRHDCGRTLHVTAHCNICDNDE